MQNRLLLSPAGPNSPRPHGTRRGADLEQPVAVGLPARLGEQPVFLGLVVAHLGGLHVADRPQVERRGGDDGPGSEAGGTPGLGQEARRRQAGAVDDETHQVPLSQAQAMVGGTRGRPWGGVEPHQPQAGIEARRQAGVDGLRRAVVDHDHLVLVGSRCRAGGRG